MSKTVELELVLLHETDGAYMVEPPNDPGNRVWLPKTQTTKGECVKNFGGESPTYEFVVSEWLAKDRELI